MTAINIVRQRNSVHIISDGAWYLPDGTIKSFASKTFPLPNMPAAVATRGSKAWHGVIGPHLGYHFANFDDLVSGIEDVMPVIYDENKDQAEHCGYTGVEIFIVGISHARAKAESYLMRTSDLPAAEGLICPEPFTLTPIPAITAAPAPDSDLLAESGLDMDEQCDGARLDRDAVHLLEVQRQMRFPFTHASEICGVGGFAQITTVSSDGVHQRILHRWEVDRIGEPLDPAPIDWQNWHGMPATMTRQQRRALARGKGRAA